MAAPDPKITVRAFPVDAGLAFYRVEVGDPAREDVLALFVERLQGHLAGLTSEIKVNLSADGATFILAFLADKQPTDTDAVHELARKAAREHAADHQ